MDEKLIARLEAAISRLEALTPKVAAPGEMTLPNYGKAKGQPVKGAALGDLTYYRDGCLRTLADPAKERFHAKERQMLAAIDAEILRQGGAADDSSAPF